MLAVVQHQQRAARGQVFEQPLHQRPVALLAQAEHGRAGGGHPFGVLQRREVDEPHAVGECGPLLLRELQRQARLAAAADAGQRQQPRRRQQAREIGQRRLAPDEAGARLRQVVAQRRRPKARGHRRLQPAPTARTAVNR